MKKRKRALERLYRTRGLCSALGLFARFRFGGRSARHLVVCGRMIATILA